MKKVVLEHDKQTGCWGAAQKKKTENNTAEGNKEQASEQEREREREREREGEKHEKKDAKANKQICIKTRYKTHQEPDQSLTVPYPVVS